MKLTRKMLCCILLTQSICSCKYLVELNDIPEGNAIFAECLANERDTTFLRVRLAMPSTSAPIEIPVDNAKISLNSNDSEYEMQKYGKDADGRYFLSGLEFHEGDVLKVSISVPGYDSVKAEDSVPERPDYAYSVSMENYTLWHHLVFRNVGVGKNVYYGLRLYMRNVSSQQWLLYDNVYLWRHTVGDAEHIWLKEEDYGEESSTTSMFDKKFLNAEINGQPMLIFSSASLEDSNKLNICGTYWQDRSYSNPDNVGVNKYQYQAVVFQLSDQLAKYIFNRYKVDANLAGKYGFAAPTMSYSNVDGGYGVLGCFSKQESGWIDNAYPCEDLTRPEHYIEWNDSLE